MAVYAHTEAANPPFSLWIDAFAAEIPRIIFSDLSTRILTNTDGSWTIVSGTGFGFGFDGAPTTGTIASISRVNEGATILYESITGLALSLPAFWNAPDNGTRWSQIFAGADTLVGFSGDDHLIGGAAADAFFGGLAPDVASYETASDGVSVDLRNPAENTGEAAGDTFDSIEGLYGSLFNDDLQGDDNENNITGYDGADNLAGHGGSDSLFGSAGFDTVWYNWEEGGGAVFVNLNAGLAIDTHGAVDVVAALEGVVGGLGADGFIGSDEDNQFRGLGGADYIDGAGGVDVINYDLDLVYGATSGVYVEFLGGFGNGGFVIDAFGALDFIINIERAVGTHQADTMLGDAVDNAFRGGDGVDFLNGRGGADILEGDAGKDTLIGGLGADLLDGGEGLDFIRYDFSEEGVTIDLFNGVGSFGDAAGDLIFNVEGVIGSSQGDVVYGDQGANVLIGGEGDDVIFGFGGDDTIFGEDVGGSGVNGSDLLFGGAGADTFIIDRGSDLEPANFDTIVDFDAEDSIWLDWPLVTEFMFENAGAVVITSIDNGFQSGVIVLNATIAQIQDQLVYI